MRSQRHQFQNESAIVKAVPQQRQLLAHGKFINPQEREIALFLLPQLRIGHQLLNGYVEVFLLVRLEFFYRLLESRGL